MFASIISKPAARPTLRSVSITALMAVTLLAGQSFAAQAQAPAAPAAAAAPAPAAPPAAANAAAPANPAQAKAESVEDRITSLHASLKITAAEEADWTGVADVMRSNAAAMAKLSTEKTAKDPASMTAVDDLKNYELFAQAHVTGLKKLVTAFDKLYTAMPAAQKKIADGVFQSAGHEHAASHG
jgi:type IV secretory pathway VirB10-like protein